MRIPIRRIERRVPDYNLTDDEPSTWYHKPPTKVHQHDKVYANTMLASYPPQIPWVCRECLAKGADRVEYGDTNNHEYNELLRKAEQQKGS